MMSGAKDNYPKYNPYLMGPPIMPGMVPKD